MTAEQAKNAMMNRIKVEAGDGEDYDTGILVDLEESLAIVAWQSGVRTPCPIADLEVV